MIVVTELGFVWLKLRGLVFFVKNWICFVIYGSFLVFILMVKFISFD